MSVVQIFVALFLVWPWSRTQTGSSARVLHNSSLLSLNYLVQSRVNISWKHRVIKTCKQKGTRHILIYFGSSLWAFFMYSSEKCEKLASGHFLHFLQKLNIPTVHLDLSILSRLSKSGWRSLGIILY